MDEFIDEIEEAGNRGQADQEESPATKAGFLRCCSRCSNSPAADDKGDEDGAALASLSPLLVSASLSAPPGRTRRGS